MLNEEYKCMIQPTLEHETNAFSAGKNSIVFAPDNPINKCTCDTSDTEY